MNEYRETALQALRPHSDWPDKVPARKGEVARNPIPRRGAVGGSRFSTKGGPQLVNHCLGQALLPGVFEQCSWAGFQKVGNNNVKLGGEGGGGISGVGW